MTDDAADREQGPGAATPRTATPARAHGVPGPRERGGERGRGRRRDREDVDQSQVIGGTGEQGGPGIQDGPGPRSGTGPRGGAGEQGGPSEWAVPGQVGAGPWPGGRAAWPSDQRYDPELLEHGDARNVVDAYRYWRRDAVAADLAARAHPFHVAIENFGHDHNIGTVVRTANAFAAAGVHIVGRRRWNRRGAMVTDRYLQVHHHDDVAGLAAFAHERGLAIVAVDNTAGAQPLETADLPRDCVLLFGQEGPGVTGDAHGAAAMTVSIAQFGSTRSINAGVAAGVAMHAWIRQHADLGAAW